MGRNRSKSSRSGRPVCVCGLVSHYCAFRKKHAMAFNTGSLSGPPGFPPLQTVPAGAVSIPTAVGSGQAAAAFRPAGSFHGSDVLVSPPMTRQLQHGAKHAVYGGLALMLGRHRASCKVDW